MTVEPHEFRPAKGWDDCLLCGKLADHPNHAMPVDGNCEWEVVDADAVFGFSYCGEPATTTRHHASNGLVKLCDPHSKEFDREYGPT